MPALTKVTIQKTFNQRYWVNVYHLDTAVADSADAAVALIAAERAVHHISVLLTTCRLATVTPGDDVYVTLPVNQFGQKNSGATNMMATFIAARIDFACAVGRPSRKFIRGSLQEEEVNGWTLAGPGASLYATYGAAVIAVPGICDVDGEELTGSAVWPEITGRQHRRGSKKKSIP